MSEYVTVTVISLYQDALKLLKVAEKKILIWNIVAPKNCNLHQK